MKEEIVKWIIVIVQNIISEYISSGKNNLIQKCKLKKFRKDIQQDIEMFCNNYQSIYIESSAFAYYLRYSKVLDKTFHRAVSDKLELSNKEFLRQQIKEARNIAQNEDVIFTHDDERFIKELIKLIERKISDFYLNKLSAEQRYCVSKVISEIKDLTEVVIENQRVNNNNINEMKKAIQDISSLSDTKAELVLQYVVEKIWSGNTKDLNVIETLVEGKSKDLELAIGLLRNVICADGNEIEQVKNIGGIKVRDIVIRALLPMIYYKKIDATMLSEFTSNITLKDIVLSLDKNLDCIVQVVEKEQNGMHIFEYKLSKKYVFEEAWLVKQLVVLHLYNQNIRNVDNSMEEITKNEETWLSNLLMLDKRIDILCAYGKNSSKVNEIKKIYKNIYEKKECFSQFGIQARVLYYSILLKAAMFSMDDWSIISEIPTDIAKIEPIRSLIMQAKIDNDEIKLEELKDYCIKNGNGWLINNYFAKHQDSKEIIEFWRNNQEIVVNNYLLFFVLLGALKSQSEFGEIKNLLEFNKNAYENYYEYWNEVLQIDKTEKIEKEFFEICKNDNLRFIYPDSEYSIIERLLSYDQIDLAEKYISRLKIQTKQNDWRICKYDAILLMKRERYIEAIEKFKASFELFSRDSYVIDSIISLSLQHNRQIEQKHIDAAVNIGLPRLLILVSAAYMQKGNDIDARRTNIKAILKSDKDDVQALSQFLSYERFARENSTRKILGIEENTVAYTEDGSGNMVCFGVHSDSVLPDSPCIWNGAVHMYVTTAAEYGMLRKKVNDYIIYENMQYRIVEVVPLECYFFREGIKKLETAGVVHTLRIPETNGKMDTDAFINWIKEFTPDGRIAEDWLGQYSNLEDVPLPLFTYKRFVNMNYTKFLVFMYENCNYFIREWDTRRFHSKKYILSFSAFIAMVEMGIPIETLLDNNVYITESTQIQIDGDTTEIINEYNKDVSSTIGVFENQLFINSANEDVKQHWMQIAGTIQKYNDKMLMQKNEYDLQGEFLTSFDVKELVGICDYDAISISSNDEDFCLITNEAFFVGISANSDCGFRVISITDWLMEIGIDVYKLIEYMAKLVAKGCFFAINLETLKYISEKLDDLDETDISLVYDKFIKLMGQFDGLPEKSKVVALKHLSDVLMSVNQEETIDPKLAHVFLTSLITLNKLKITFRINDEGELEYAIYKENDDTSTITGVSSKE